MSTGTPGLILSAGCINADFVVRVDARPGPGNTTIGRDLLATSGGKAANDAWEGTDADRLCRAIVEATEAAGHPVESSVDAVAAGRALHDRGAGDAFAGTVAVALLEVAAAVRAGAYGVAASSIAISTYGSQEAYPDRPRLDAMAARVEIAPAR